MKKITLLLLILIAMRVFAVTEYFYIEKTGKKKDSIKVTEDKNELENKIEINYEGQIYYLTTDKNNSTKSYVHNENGEEYNFFIEDRTIFSESKNCKLEDGIWMQTVYFNNDFINSKEKKRKIYLISSNFKDAIDEAQNKKKEDDQIALMHLIMKKKGREYIDVLGEKRESIKVIITFDDFRSIFWRAKYWYDSETGILLRSEERRGGPGTDITIRYIEGID